MMSLRPYVGGIAFTCFFSYMYVQMSRPDEVKSENIDKSLISPDNKSQLEVLKAAAHSDKPLYMLSKKEIDQIIFSKRDK